MVFGLFGKNKVESRVNEIVDSVNYMHELHESLRNEFEKYKKESAVYLASHDMKIKDIIEEIENIEGVKESKEPKTKIKIPTTQAVLNILENNVNPLDFNYIFGNINKYDLKRKNPSPKLVKRSIYNLIYNGKVACGKKRGTYQICKSPTKH